MAESKKNRALVWGGAIGFCLMLLDAFSLNFRFNREPLAAKMVGGAVTQAQLNEALTRLGQPVEREVRQQVLDFLIDEELLVLRAKSVGLVESDRTIRKALSRAVIDQQVKAAIAHSPSKSELRGFYDDHRALFTSGEKIYLKQLFFKKGDVNEEVLQGSGRNAKDRAEVARRALLSGDGSESLGDPLPSALPETLIPVSILHRTLGPTMAALVKTLRTGQVSDVIDSGGGYHLFICRDFTAAQLRPYEAIKDEVLSEYRRRARDYALEKKLRELWARSDIRITEKLNIDQRILSQSLLNQSLLNPERL
jgi:PPIC-type PPIASE domain